MPIGGGFYVGHLWAGRVAVYFDVTVPLNLTSMQLDANGAPSDEVGYLLGYTKEGVSFRAHYDLLPGSADQARNHDFEGVGFEEAEISGTMLQIGNPILMGLLMPQATLVANTLFFLGGSPIPIQSAGRSVLFSGKRPDNLRMAVLLYHAVNTADTEWQMKTSGVAEPSFTFKALRLPTRAAGDQFGQIYVENV